MMTEEPEGNSAPWELRLCQVVPLPPLVTGALIALIAATASLLWYEFIIGTPIWNPNPNDASWLSPGPSSALMFCVLCGYMIGAFGHGAAGAERDRARSGTREPIRQVDSGGTILARSRIYGSMGIAGMWAVTGTIWLLGDEPLWQFLQWNYPALLSQSLLGWMIGRIAYLSLQPNPDMIAVLEHSNLDLLDLSRERGVGHAAVRNCLLSSIGFALVVPYLVTMPSGEAPILAVFLAPLVSFPVLLLVLPLRAVRRRIRAAKATALEELDVALLRARDAAISGETGTPGRLADLLVYRTYVVGINDWPFDSTALLRLGLYLLIPISSWVASAFVERAVNTALD